MARPALVDTHAHFTTERYVEVAKRSGHVGPDGMPEEYWPSWSAQEHLAMMDDVGIATSVLSVSSPGVQLDGVDVPGLAAEVNDVAAAAVREHPGRFGFFASIPALEEDAALAEIDRRGAVLFVHPTTPPGFEGFSCGRPAPMMEFLFDTTRTVVDFVLSGAGQRFQDVRLVVPHMGSVIPPLIAKMSELASIFGTGGWHEEVLERVWWDLAGVPNDAQLHGLDLVGRRDHLLYGSDDNFTRAPVVRGLLTELDDLQPEGWRQSVGENAARLLGRDPGQAPGPRRAP